MVVELGYIKKDGDMVHFSLGEAKYIDTILNSSKFTIEDYELVYVLKDENDIVCIANMEDKENFLKHIDDIALFEKIFIKAIIRIDALYNTDKELKVLYKNLVSFLQDIQTTTFVRSINIDNEGCDIIGINMCQGLIDTYWKKTPIA